METRTVWISIIRAIHITYRRVLCRDTDYMHISRIIGCERELIESLWRARIETVIILTLYPYHTIFVFSLCIVPYGRSQLLLISLSSVSQTGLPDSAHFILRAAYIKLLVGPMLYYNNSTVAPTQFFLFTTLIHALSLKR